MKQFAPPGNGGKPGELDALYAIYPWLKAFAGIKDVSVIYLRTTDELVDHSYETSANGYNTTGRIVLLKDHLATRDVTWNNVFAERKSLGIAEWNIASPQTLMTGEEDTCVILHDHDGDHDSTFKGFSIDVFMCPEGRSFKDYPKIVSWIAEPRLRMELRAAGFRA